VAAEETHGEHGGEPAALRRKRPVAHRVDAAVKTVRSAGARPALEHGLRHPEAAELHQRDHAILATGNLGEQPIGCGDLSLHMDA